MTDIKDKIRDCIFSSIDNYNGFQPKELQLEKNTGTVLFSRSGFTKEGKLDSMGLVNLLVLVEEKVKADIKPGFTLDITEVIENKETLLTTIDALINYLYTKVK